MSPSFINFTGTISNFIKGVVLALFCEVPTQAVVDRGQGAGELWLHSCTHRNFLAF